MSSLTVITKTSPVCRGEKQTALKIGEGKKGVRGREPIHCKTGTHRMNYSRKPRYRGHSTGFYEREEEKRVPPFEESSPAREGGEKTRPGYPARATFFQKLRASAWAGNGKKTKSTQVIVQTAGGRRMHWQLNSWLKWCLRLVGKKSVQIVQRR